MSRIGNPSSNVISPARAMTLVEAMAEASLCHELKELTQKIEEGASEKRRARTDVRALIRESQRLEQQARMPHRPRGGLLGWRAKLDWVKDFFPGAKGTRDKALDGLSRLGVDLERAQVGLARRDAQLDELQLTARDVEDAHRDSKDVVETMRRDLETAQRALCA